ncbi:MAG: SpoIIIAH-like family protein [Oscillospiraceae bacterium]|nr:SpoIIIAH-like family protein [Oscillospiraceae bacterium]
MRKSTTNRKMTLLTLTVALTVAVYLNWEYARSADLAMDVAASQTVTGEAAEKVVTDGLPTAAEPEPTANKTYGEAQLVSASAASSESFFEEARLARTKARDEALDSLQKSLKKSSLSEEEKSELTERLTSEINAITQESDVEALVKAKGFVDCVAYVGSGKVDVTVMTTGDELTAAEVTQIRDIVLSKCAVTAQNITVVEVK